MKKNSFAEIFYKNAGYVAVILISTIYIASSLILISKTGRSIYEIIGTGALSMIVGIMINGVFRSIGISRGESDEKTALANQKYNMAVEEIEPYADMLDSFCEAENKRALKSIRCRILAGAGMKYEDFFDENGVVINNDFRLYTQEYISAFKGWRHRRALKRQNKKRRSALKKAIDVKIKLLSGMALTAQSVKENNPFDFGKNKNEYVRARSATDILIRVVMAIIFGAFGVSFVNEVNIATLIWNSLQIIMYLTGGVIQMYSSYSWVVDEYTQGLSKKVDILNKFKIFARKNEQK
ncbi:MAG: hypothetical protein J6K52_03525 [Clostridia bacterium]|nr:hypothetical protein [Clostridia bacterium]